MSVEEAGTPAPVGQDRLGRVQTQLQFCRAGLGMGRRLFCQCSLLTSVKLSLSVTCGVSK